MENTANVGVVCGAQIVSEYAEYAVFGEYAERIYAYMENKQRASRVGCPSKLVWIRNNRN
jgi:hypothetical protein